MQQICVCNAARERGKWGREGERVPQTGPQRINWGVLMPSTSFWFPQIFSLETTNKLKGTLIATAERKSEWERAVEREVRGGATVNCRLLKYAKLTRHNYNTQNADKHA